MFSAPEELSKLEDGLKTALNNQEDVLSPTNFIKAQSAQAEARSLLEKQKDAEDKQGDALLIRLKGLEFPTAQATLKGSNFSLLGKVQNVIHSFGNSSITVEGHTDSVGGVDSNLKLSTQRAEAVKDYLSTNLGDAQASIKAVGYGYQKPLASNKTASGRAQNRRVDIVIEPEQSSQTE